MVDNLSWPSLVQFGLEGGRGLGLQKPLDGVIFILEDLNGPIDSAGNHEYQTPRWPPFRWVECFLVEGLSCGS